MKWKRILRFLILLVPCTILRFYAGKNGVNFLWFAILYLPIINWIMYWTMSSIRLGINKLAGKELIPVPRLRQFYVWYLKVPGALVISELIYRGYLFNR